MSRVARLTSGAVLGIDAQLVDVQCDISGGLPIFHIVGLPEKEVSESRERIRSAIKNSGYSFPTGRITANLAPADVRKVGVGFDLPIALAILLSSEQLPLPRQRWMFVGELSLSGELRGIPGVLALAMTASEEAVDGLVVPKENADEAAMIEQIPVFPVSSLADVVSLVCDPLAAVPHTPNRQMWLGSGPTHAAGFDHIRGQMQAKRALEISAAGGHNLVMTGPPGAGKSMLARCLPELLPPLSADEALETARIYSIAGLLDRSHPMITERPFRAPHHTISYAGMVGGGHGIPGPGEISLAHHGVLFLDELPEFDRRVLETLRQPLEDRSILISRAGMGIRYPSSFTLVGAMNPCPCGFLGDDLKACTCTLLDIQRYRRRLSGPLLDRVDLFVDVPRVPVDDLFLRKEAEMAESVATRVRRARALQWERYAEWGGLYANAGLQGDALEEFCRLDAEAETLVKRAVARFQLSARAYVRVLRVARTIADLEGEASIGATHVAEAIQYRAHATGDQ